MKQAWLAAIIALGVPNISAPVRSPIPARDVVYTPPFVGGKQRPQSAKNADVVSVADAGAKCDGVTDDSAAFNAAILTGGTIHVPGRTCKLTSTLTFSTSNTTLSLDASANLLSTANPAISVAASNITIHGDGLTSTITVSSATNEGIVTTSAANSLTLEGFVMQLGAAGVRTGGTAIKLVSISAPVLKRLYINDPWNGINVSGGSTGSMRDIKISTTFAAQSLNDGIYFTNTSIQWSLLNVAVQSANAWNASFVFGKETDTLLCEFCFSFGPAAYGMWWKNEAGTYKPRWIKIIAPTIEVAHTTGVDFQIDYTMSTEITNGYSAWGLNNIIVNSNAQDVRIIGGEYMLAYQYGMLVNGGQDITVSDALFSDSGQQTNNTYAGIAVGNSVTGPIKLTGNTSGNVLFNGASPASATNFMADGIYVGTGNNNYTIANNDVRVVQGTTGLNLNSSGTNSQVYGNRMKGQAGFIVQTGMSMNSSSTLTLGTVTQATLGTPGNGTLLYCSDCTTASACTGGGTGALASRQNGAWKCL